MRIISTMQDRLAVKTETHTLAQLLMTRYSLSIAEAECLTSELQQRQRQAERTPLDDGQIWYTAVSLAEPAGKPLARCQTLRIRLTLHVPNDLFYRAEHGLVALRHMLVSRLCFEAFQQQALLAQEDLCRLLLLSRATIQRILATFRKQGDYIPTRGNFHDIGPAMSHKYQAVRLYLRGFQPTTIAQRLCHHLSSIERYLDAFCRVMAALDQGFSVPAIARFTRHSHRLVREYQSLYEQFKDAPECQDTLQSLRRRISYLQTGQKGGL